MLKNKKKVKEHMFCTKNVWETKPYLRYLIKYKVFFDTNSRNNIVFLLISSTPLISFKYFSNFTSFH